jgi:hypothetical protein
MHKIPTLLDKTMGRFTMFIFVYVMSQTRDILKTVHNAAALS